MKKKVVNGIMLILLLIGTLTLAFNVQPAKAGGTIYIRADGSVYPPTANITSVNNVTYYFTDNINSGIVVERSNIIVDGNGYTLQGLGSGYGFNLTSINNVTIKNMEIRAFEYGIWLDKSSNNSISKNNITNNRVGIHLCSCSNNFIYHNNFVNNTNQIHDLSWDYPYVAPSINVWDDGYPSGGNYWGNHNPPDIYSGPHQNETGRDGIGDVPYIIDENNTDRYPLIYPYGFVPSPDLNDDGIVNMFDIVICALAFGSQPGDPNWNPIATTFRPVMKTVFKSEASIDGFLHKSSITNWTACIADTPTADTTSLVIWLGMGYQEPPVEPRYECAKSYISFDTSTLGSVTIHSAKLKMHTTSQNTTDPDFNVLIRGNTQPLYGSQLTAEDWNCSTATLVSWNTANWQSETWFTFDIDTAQINTQGKTQFEIVSDRELNETEPTSAEEIQFYSGDSEATYGLAPRLEIWYVMTVLSIGWNNFSDLNQDGIVDIFDLVIIGINYGKTV